MNAWNRLGRLLSYWQTWASIIVLCLLMALVWPWQANSMFWLVGPLGIYGGLIAWALVLVDLVGLSARRPYWDQIGRETAKMLTWLAGVIISTFVMYVGPGDPGITAIVLMARLALVFTFIFLQG